MKKIPEILEIHQKGLLSIEKKNVDSQICDIGIQTAEDGRIWICINGEAFIRFKPLPTKYMEKEKDVL